MIHREFQGFEVILESINGVDGSHVIMGRGGEGIAAGDVVETRYRGTAERWRVRSISREPGLHTWAATVVAVPALRLVA